MTVNLLLVEDIILPVIDPSECEFGYEILNNIWNQIYLIFSSFELNVLLFLG